ncbi:unnamed protein product [Rhizoctonia solani]|uniref:Uncharacterized protein n=1 Tax=Rhizoctonia solani TaxID=456999 RepID=A0A8H3BMQ0_9AGAM|nr:unnamed protein product [Rhizoctonia solani]
MSGYLIQCSCDGYPLRVPIFKHLPTWNAQSQLIVGPSTTFTGCLEASCAPEERKRIAEVMRGRVIELATNHHGTHVVEKALDSAEAIQIMVVWEMSGVIWLRL